MNLDEGESLTSEEAFDAMNKIMPGEKAIRITCEGNEGIQKSEVYDGILFLEKLRNAYFLKDLDYYPRELIKSRIEALIYELERYI